MSTEDQNVYEYTDGSHLQGSWAGKQVPVPPQKVRSRLRLPSKYALATLAPVLADTYNPVFYQVARKYLANWPAYSSKGQGPIFVGPARSGSSYVAAALSNEIASRSQAKSLADIQMSWLSCFWILRMIQDARDLGRQEMYTSLRDSMLKSDLVVVDDLLAAKEVQGGVGFIHTVYAYRYDHNLPIITTITTENNGYWQEVEAIYGKSFVQRLRMTSEGFIARTSE
jgi:DNA replication protein DnaC